MNYPTVAEYTAAVRLAEDNMATLTSLRPVLDSHGDPLMTSGNFAAVFKMHDEATGRDYAMKCFLRQQDGRQEAYQAIMRELEYVNTSYLTHFQYLDRELFVDMQGGDDNEFPVLLMDWVEGQTLDKYVRQHLDDAYALSLLAYQFSRMAMWLLSQPFAHGDLKPDNILVRSDGSLVLVDYDGMFVPAMQGQKARELGSPDFRHPLRTVDDFNEHIDDFALASILLSLKAIALDPTLIDRHAAPDRLLFGEADYRDLSRCQALKELFPHADSELNRLIGLFSIAHATQSLAQVSFRLLLLQRPEAPAPQVEAEPISTEATYEDKENAWEDKYGAEYSQDGKRLIYVPKNLKSYTIRQGTEVICDAAFYYCQSLQGIVIPASVTHIGDSAFYYCQSLQGIVIPASVTHIGDSAFAECTSLRKIVIPDSVTHIGNSAFGCCYYLQEIVLPDSVTHIGDCAFSWCGSLQEIVIPDSVTHIGDRAFYGCTSLQKIVLPDSVTHIGDSAFENCNSLQEIVIPDSVMHIGSNPFEGCKSLNRIVCKSPNYKIQNKALYSKDGTILIGCYSRESSFTIPASVTHIGDRAFNDCDSLQEIVIPASVTHIGNYAFWSCDSLQEIVIPDSVTHIGDSAFWNCKSLQGIVIPASVTHIGDRAFMWCKSLQEIIIPKGTRSKFEEMLPGYKDKLIEK